MNRIGDMTIGLAASATRSMPVVPPGLFAQLWRRRGTWLAVFVLMVAITVGMIRVLPVSYTATGAIIVAEPDFVTGAQSSTWLQKLGDPADLESNILLIRSPRLMRQVAGDAGPLIQAECETRSQTVIARLLSAIRKTQDCRQLGESVDARLEWVQARYSVGSIGRSRVMAVAYTSPLPDVAQHMTNLLVSAFLDNEKAKRLESRVAALTWMNQEITQLGDALRRDEAKIEVFRQARGLVRGQVAAITSERLTSASQQLAQAEAAQAEAAARLRELQRGDTAETRSVLESRTIADLKQQFALVSGRLVSLAQTTGPNHPTLIALQRQRDDLRERISTETGRIAASAKNALAAANARIASDAGQLDAVKQEAGSAAGYETQTASMVRDLDIKRALYVDLSKRASQLETERRLLTTSTQLVNMAELPDMPSFPKSVPFLAGGMTVAGILASAAALWRDKAADRGLRAPGALQALTGLAVLARVPAADRGRMAMLPGERDVPLAIALSQLHTPSMLQEAVRGLYARLTLAGFGTRRRTLLFTSSEPREGKTFSALALAQFAAASGRRVLLIDCDMRRPSIQTALGLPDSAGLSEYLLGSIEAMPVIPSVSRTSMDVIVAGKASMASTELLAGPRFAGLLKQTKRYDLVVLDTPPTGMLMDACIIASKVDGVLYCARWGRVEPEQVASGLQDIHHAGGNVAGLIVTFAPQGERTPYGTNRVEQDVITLDVDRHA